MSELRLPAMGLVLLVGVSGSGKSTFAREHFAATEVVSSDVCRGLVADDETDQAATPDAFDLLHHLVGIRLRRGLLTVVDATNVQRRARAELVALARSHDVLVDAVVLDVDTEVAVARNAARPERDFGDHVVRRQAKDLARSMRGLRKEGFRRVHVVRPDDPDAGPVEIVRERSWNDRSELRGPFDLVGDVHGCATELRSLLVDLGWELTYDDAGRASGASHPEGRTCVFVGDLVDRGPDTPGVLRLVMGMVGSGTALCVSGNHEAKLVRALRGSTVNVSHGLAESLAQLEAEPEAFREEVLAFADGLISHYVLDGGRLVVAHAGLKESYHGRSSGRVRAFALYGDTTGETDSYGLPVRYPWAEDYRGDAAVVYGHTPVPTAQWLNNTICLDTGVVFGGTLTALRWPERELRERPAEQEWYAPVRPLAPAGAEREPAVLRIDDLPGVGGSPWLDTRHAGRVKVAEDHAAAALEVMSRFAVDPRWLLHLPATMSPARASGLEGYLEHPREAFEEYAAWGVGRVVCEEKHMGSRAVAVLTRDADVAERRFGVSDGSVGVVHTRTGRPFFAGADGEALVTRLRDAVAPLFDRLETDWVALDCELLPWSAKAGGLIRSQYAAVGAAALGALPDALGVLDRAAGRGLDVGELAARTSRRLDHARAYREVYASYVRPGSGLEGVTVAPFAVLAAEGRVPALTEPHPWHLSVLGSLDDPFLTATRHVEVELASDASRAAATQWWLALTGAGGEGMVVKPATLPDAATDRRTQPGLKVRGREYLRIVYGPDYTDSLDLLRGRDTSGKRRLALREHGLGLSALADAVAGEPLWKVHQSVFAVLALESQPVDPRL